MNLLVQPLSFPSGFSPILKALSLTQNTSKSQTVRPGSRLNMLWSWPTVIITIVFIKANSVLELLSHLEPEVIIVRESWKM